MLTLCPISVTCCQNKQKTLIHFVLIDSHLLTTFASLLITFYLILVPEWYINFEMTFYITANAELKPQDNKKINITKNHLL